MNSPRLAILEKTNRLKEIMINIERKCDERKTASFVLLCKRFNYGIIELGIYVATKMETYISQEPQKIILFILINILIE